MWTDDEDFGKMKDFISCLKITNDVADRSETHSGLIEHLKKKKGLQLMDFRDSEEKEPD